MYWLLTTPWRVEFHEPHPVRFDHQVLEVVIVELRRTVERRGDPGRIGTESAVAMGLM